MADTIGLSRDLQRRTGVVGGLLAAIKLHWSRLASGRRASRLHLEEWPDYLLRDVGLDRSGRDRTDPRTLPTDWPLR